jgi:DtxR family Mn-dependent transcriptional regulator
MDSFIREEDILNEKQNVVSLCDLRPGAVAEVVQIRGVDNGRLLKLSALGLVPGSLIRLQQRMPAYVIWVGETQLSLDRDVAQDILLACV